MLSYTYVLVHLALIIYTSTYTNIYTLYTRWCEMICSLRKNTSHPAGEKRNIPSCREFISASIGVLFVKKIPKESLFQFSCAKTRLLDLFLTNTTLIDAEMNSLQDEV